MIERIGRFNTKCFGATPNGTRCEVTECENCDSCNFYKTKGEYARNRLKHIDKEKEFARTKFVGFTEHKFDKFVNKLKEEAKGE